MPIFRINSDLHYFAHVPKCGGTAVEVYLTERFGPLALHEKNRHLIPDAQRWNRGTAEHLPALWLARLIPAGWLKSSFAVVRHPWRRLVSGFFFSRDMTARIPPGTDFNAWVAQMPDWFDQDPFRYEAHFARQTGFVPEGSRVFRLEDGLDQIVPYLDRLAGNTEGPRLVDARNVGKWRHDQKAPVPTAETLAILAGLYADDFARFGYAVPDSPRALDQLADLPPLGATGAPPAPGKRTLVQRLIRKLQRQIEQP